MRLIEDKFTNKPWNRQLKHYYRKVASGLCVTCRKPRGKSPALECQKCTAARNKRRKAARETKKNAAKKAR